MAQTESRSREPVVTFRVEDDEKRRMMQMRAMQLGYENRSAYIRDLIDEDLEDANLPELE